MNLSINLDEKKLTEEVEKSIGHVVRRVDWYAKIADQAVGKVSEAVTAAIMDQVGSPEFGVHIRRVFQAHLDSAIQKVATNVARGIMHDIVKKSS